MVRKGVRASLEITSRPLGRPPIGPRVDFRVPEELDAEVRRAARRLGVTTSSLYRDLVIAGRAALLGRPA